MPHRPYTRDDFVNPPFTLPVAPAVPGNSVLPFAEYDIASNPQINLACPGRMKTVLHSLNPADQARLIAGADHYNHHVELGRHGNVAKACDDMEVDAKVAKRIHEGLEVDYVCQKLQDRRSDADRPIEPPTRRDVLDAAFDAHTEEN